jgi:hypothetical protein
MALLTLWNLMGKVPVAYHTAGVHTVFIEMSYANGACKWSIRSVPAGIGHIHCLAAITFPSVYGGWLTMSETCLDV